MDSVKKKIDIEEFLNKLNREFEQSFTIAYLTCQEFELDDLSQYTAKRVFSYNPNSSIIQQSCPNYAKIIGEISKLVSNHGQLLKENINLVDSWIILGHCYLTIGDFPNAFASYSHALNASTQLIDPHFSYGLAIVYYHFKYTDSSLQILTSLLNYPQPLPYHSDILFRTAVVSRETKQFANSIYYFQQLANQPPNGLKSNDILLQIAYSYKLSDQEEVSGEIIEKLTKENPDSLELFHYYVQLLFSQKNYQKVKSVIETCLTKHPLDPIFTIVQGRLAFLEKKVDVALKCYRECYSYWSVFVQYWGEIATIYYSVNMYDEAINMLMKAVSCDKTNQKVWNNILFLDKKKNGGNSNNQIISQAMNNIEDKEFKQRVIMSTNPKNKMEWEPFDMNLILENEPEIFAKAYMSTPPILPVECFGDSKSNFSELSYFPKSFF